MFSLAIILAACSLGAAPPPCDAPRTGDGAGAVALTRGVFAQPLSDSALARTSGRAGLEPTGDAFSQLADDQARQDFRASGDIARTQMDVWWGSTGSQMIANSVRAASESL